jgi:branched-chain amino acid transport system substrate-binding protein
MNQIFRWLFVLSLSLFVGFISSSYSQEKSEIVIGASLPLSGAITAHGRDVKWAYELAAKNQNAEGGIFVKDYGKKLNVKLVIVNDESNPMKAAANVEKLIKIDKVDMLLGGREPTCVFAACMTADRYKTYHHTAFGFPSQLWLEKKFKWSTNFFFSVDQAAAVPFEILNAIDSQHRPRKIAFVVEDSFNGKAFASSLQQAAKKFGKEIALQIELPVGAKSYSAQVSQLKESGVDSILLYASEQDLEVFLRQIKKENVNIPYIQTWKGGSSGMLWKDLGKDAQYVIVDGFWSMDYPFKGAKELGEQYEKTFNEYSITVGLPYALAQCLFQSIEKAGSLDGAKVRDAVLTHTFETVMGSLKYDQNGFCAFPANAAQWWEGKPMLVHPVTHSTWELKLAPPWDKR